MISKGQIKIIKSLIQKKYRKQHRLFLVEGVKIINELLLSAYKIRTIYGTEKWAGTLPDSLYQEHKEVIQLVSSSEIDQISLMETPNEVLALVEIPEARSIDLKSELLLCLDGIRDPGNMGTIIRTADWFGLTDIICSEDCVDLYNPKVVQASMGSIFRVNVSYRSIKEFIKENSRFNLYLSTMKGEPVNIFHPELPALVVVGNESNGIRSELLELKGTKISIPGFGKAESLNAAVATGIILNIFNKTGN